MNLNKAAAIAGILSLVFAVYVFFNSETKDPDPDMEIVDWTYLIDSANTAMYTCTWNGNKIGILHDCKGAGTCGSKPAIISHCKLEYASQVKRILMGVEQ